MKLKDLSLTCHPFIVGCFEDCIKMSPFLLSFKHGNTMTTHDLTIRQVAATFFFNGANFHILEGGGREIKYTVSLTS